MEISELVLQYVSVLAWPLVAVGIVFGFRKTLNGLLPGAKVTFTMAGVTIETTLSDLERSVSESLRGRKLSPDHWKWLDQLWESGRTTYDKSQYEILRPLRNAGLIREHPEGWLSNAAEIEITPLGALLLEARGESSS